MRRLLILLIFIAVGVGALPAAASETVGPNSGLPGSTCEAAKLPVPYTAPGPGIATSGFGSDAPGYYEIGRPTGAFEGAKPKGIMLVIHGGAWYMVGKEAVVTARPSADRWRAQGWLTVSIDYRACAQSIKDVVWFMKKIRAARPDAVVCAMGMSAGGHLALLLASVRNDVACVVALAGPSDLNALIDQTAYNPTLQTRDSYGPTLLYYTAAAAFGADPNRLRFFSPTSYVGTMRARVLLVMGEHDVVVPLEQNHDYAAALRAAQPDAYVDSAVLGFGAIPFVHTGISLAARDELLVHEQALVAPLVA